MSTLAVTLILLLVPTLAPAQVFTVSEVLIRSVDAVADRALAADPLEISLALDRFEPPVADEVWHRATADSTGWIRDDALDGGYAFATVTVGRDTTLILEGMGYQAVRIDDDWRVGNIYGHTDQWESWQPRFDFSLLPVRLRRGENHLLFAGNRYGVLRARFAAATAPLQFNPRDLTLPDLVVGEAVDAWGAVVVINATEEMVTDGRLGVRLAGAEVFPGGPSPGIPLPPLPPLSVRKVAFPLRAAAPDGPGSRTLELSLERGDVPLGSIQIELRVVDPHANRRVTFVSALDGSVQYYGLLPARGGDTGPKALVLSLHGAAVEALNQSASYAPLEWAHVVAPTNRRPFGFNWEDWGRLDALEALAHARETLDIAPDRVYLTGHSMGGHGAWHLAALHPDRFAAVGPSAGWISFWSYRPDQGAEPASPLAAMVQRATLPSHTLDLAPNLAELGVYVLHGEDDDVVSVEEARAMRARLADFHHDVDFHEQPGAGHWWDLSDSPGADCVAWAPMFDFFARHRRPAAGEVRAVRFSTPSPGVSSWNRWACVAEQERSFVMSTMDLHLDPLVGRLTGTTENVTVLGIDAAQVVADSLRIELDGDVLTVATPANGAVWLRRDETWRPTAAPDPRRKNPRRAGGFREAFARRVRLVYATGGTPQENAWALARARYDAEWLWYQGNASLDVLPDTLYDPSAEPDRNVILYGNADTHARWSSLWSDEDVSVHRGSVAVGQRVFEGDGLAVLAVRPRPGSDVASVGLVAGTGLAGCRLTDRRPYLTPGVAYPDLTLLEDRSDGRVVRAAGFFGNDWSVAGGEFVWEDGP